MTTPTPAPSEGFAERLARLNITPCREIRAESLRIAHEAGVDDATMCKIGTATLTMRRGTMLLPVHRKDALFRGRSWYQHSWCWRGSGKKIVWAEKDNNGLFICSPGVWTVRASDGCQTKQTTWKVEAIRVGAERWTVASERSALSCSWRGKPAGTTPTLTPTPTPMTTARDIIREYLRTHGYDGLAHPDPHLECGCGIDDLAPCESDCTACVPARRVINTDGERAYVPTEAP